MKISVWYHTRLFGGEPEINSDFSTNLMLQQMRLMKACGLEDAASEIMICVNGDSENQTMARILAPAKAKLIENGADSKSMLRTINTLRQWCQTHQDWLVCFWHIKGVTHPGDRLNELWRLCMERHVIRHWQKCYNDCEDGFDSAGTHWLTKEVYGPQVTFPFWGGMFWWAKASFLAGLPVLPNTPRSRADWFLSENWIGMGRYPVVNDYACHWPGVTSCRANL